ILTYPKASDVQQAAKDAPLDRILVETDAPYLAPVPNRGKRNEPSFLVHTVQKLADLRGEPVETIAAATTANWVRICLPGTRANG
ncbi:MAG: TatD family hydrolase, partial [Bryobacteraceae bacterium]|nr:TatD family hydrolase [Bryobacteraceae bacterium]